MWWERATWSEGLFKKIGVIIQAYGTVLFQYLTCLRITSFTTRLISTIARGVLIILSITKIGPASCLILLASFISFSYKISLQTELVLSIVQLLADLTIKINSTTSKRRLAISRTNNNNQGSSLSNHLKLEFTQLILLLMVFSTWWQNIRMNLFEAPDWLLSNKWINVKITFQISSMTSNKLRFTTKPG